MLRRYAAGIVCSIALSACGIKGPLTLPPAAKAAATPAPSVPGEPLTTTPPSATPTAPPPAEPPVAPPKSGAGKQ